MKLHFIIAKVQKRGHFVHEIALYKIFYGYEHRCHVAL